jgi:hypothetical protein
MMNRLLGVLFCSLFLLASDASVAAGGALVLVAKGGDVAARHAPGSKVAFGTTFELAESETVVLLLGKRTRRFTGPGSFTLGNEAAGGATPGDGGLDALVAFLRRPEGGRVTVGAVRGGSVERPPNLWLVDATTNGPKCIRGDAPPVLWRGSDVPATRVSIEAMETGIRRFFDWPAGESTIWWPERLPVKDRAHYLVDLGQQRHREISLQRIGEMGDEPGILLLQLSERGCLGQIEMLLFQIE